MYSFVELQRIETTSERQKHCDWQKLGFNLKSNEFLVNVNSLCYDSLLHLAQILTNLASLHSAFNGEFGNVSFCEVATN